MAGYRATGHPARHRRSEAVVSPATIVARLVAMRAELDDLIARATQPEEKPVERLPPRVSPRAYARARGYTDGTVRRWCAAGMPHVGEGRARRVVVAEADAWIAAGGPQRASERAERSGRKAAAARAIQ